MKITREPFGKTKTGRPASLFTLENSRGYVAKITDYGASLVALTAPDKKSQPVDVVLGYDNVSAYESAVDYMGAVVGRCANRIRGSVINIDGEPYQLSKNEIENHLHGGVEGFDKKLWEVDCLGDNLIFHYCSSHMEEGYPGTLNADVAYSYTDDNELRITLSAVTTKKTACNLTSHGYFNLNGHNAGDILNHEIQIFADAFTWADDSQITDGRILDVSGTPMDLREKTVIGHRIDHGYDQLVYGGGFDRNWVVKGYDDTLKKVAVVSSPDTGISMTVSSNMPGIQFYTGNFISWENGKRGAKYGRRQGLCLEPQYFPNAFAHDNFIKPLLQPGQKYYHEIRYSFEVNNE